MVVVFLPFFGKILDSKCKEEAGPVWNVGREHNFCDRILKGKTNQSMCCFKNDIAWNALAQRCYLPSGGVTFSSITRRFNNNFFLPSLSLISALFLT